MENKENMNYGDSVIPESRDRLHEAIAGLDGLDDRGEPRVDDGVAFERESRIRMEKDERLRALYMAEYSYERRTSERDARLRTRLERREAESLAEREESERINASAAELERREADEHAERLRSLLRMMESDSTVSPARTPTPAPERAPARIKDAAVYDSLELIADDRDGENDVDFTPLVHRSERCAERDDECDAIKNEEDRDVGYCIDDTVADTPEADDETDAVQTQEPSGEEPQGSADEDEPERHFITFGGERRDDVLHISGMTLPVMEKQKTADRERRQSEDEGARDYSLGQLKRLAKERMRTDVAYVSARYNDKLRALELEYSTASMRFGKRNKQKGERSLRTIRSEMNRVDHAMRRELRRERADNRRYYRPLSTDFSSARLKEGADRAGLMELRDELFRKLARRDELNRQLITLYSGCEPGGDSVGLDALMNAELGGKRVAYKKQSHVDKMIYKYHVSVSDSNKLYSMMDQYVELSGRIARISFRLKNDGPSGRERRELVRERRALSRKRSDIDGDIKFNLKRSVRAADARRKARFYTVVGFILFAVLAAGGLLLWANFDAVSAYIGGLLGG